MSTKFPNVIQIIPPVLPKRKLIEGTHVLGGETKMCILPFKSARFPEGVVKIKFGTSATYHEYLSALALRELSEFCLEAAAILEANK